MLLLLQCITCFTGLGIPGMHPQIWRDQVESHQQPAYVVGDPIGPRVPGGAPTEAPRRGFIPENLPRLQMAGLKLYLHVIEISFHQAHQSNENAVHVAAEQVQVLSARERIPRRGFLGPKPSTRPAIRATQPPAKRRPICTPSTSPA
jgi:hypothetical protein